MGGGGMKGFKLNCWSQQVQTQSVSHERHHDKLSAPDSPRFAWSALSGGSGSVRPEEAERALGRARERDVMSTLQALKVFCMCSPPNVLPTGTEGRMGLFWFWLAGPCLVNEVLRLSSLKTTDLSLKSLVKCSVEYDEAKKSILYFAFC